MRAPAARARGGATSVQRAGRRADGGSAASGTGFRIFRRHRSGSRPAGGRRAGSQDRRPRDRGRAPEERARPPRQQGAQAALRLRPRGVEGLPGRPRPLDRRLRRVQPAELRERQAGSAESLRRRALRALHGLQVHRSHHPELRARVRARRRRERHGRRGRGRVPRRSISSRGNSSTSGPGSSSSRWASSTRSTSRRSSTGSSAPRSRSGSSRRPGARAASGSFGTLAPGPRLPRVRAERHDGERVLQRKRERRKQEGSFALANDFAGTARLDYTPFPGSIIGGLVLGGQLRARRRLRWSHAERLHAPLGDARAGALPGSRAARARRVHEHPRCRPRERGARGHDRQGSVRLLRRGRLRLRAAGLPRRARSISPLLPATRISTPRTPSRTDSRACRGTRSSSTRSASTTSRIPRSY